MFQNKKAGKAMTDHAPVGFVLFMSWVGAAVYFVQNSAGFLGFIGALLKSIVWPAFLIHRAFSLMGV